MSSIILKGKIKVQKVFKLIIALLCVTMHSFALKSVNAMDILYKAHDARTKVYNSSNTTTKDIYQEMYGYTHTISRVLEKKPSANHASTEQKLDVMRAIVGGIAALEDQYFKSQFIDGLPANDNQIPIHFVKPTSDFDTQTERRYEIIERTQELARKLYRVSRAGYVLDGVDDDFAWLQSNSGIKKDQFLKLFGDVVGDHFVGIAALGRGIKDSMLLQKRIGGFRKHTNDPVPQIRVLIEYRSALKEMSEEEVNNVEKFMAQKYKDAARSAVVPIKSNDAGVSEYKADRSGVVVKQKRNVTFAESAHFGEVFHKEDYNRRPYKEDSDSELEKDHVSGESPLEYVVFESLTKKSVPTKTWDGKYQDTAEYKIEMEEKRKQDAIRMEKERQERLVLEKDNTLECRLCHKMNHKDLTKCVSCFTTLSQR